jgi:uncharacterized membrane protein YfcA
MIEILYIFLFSVCAGGIGVIFGIGGMVLIIPFLVIVLDVPLRVAVAASMASVIATSLSGSINYLRQGLVNYRISTVCEIATCFGAAAGVFLGILMGEKILQILFCFIILLACFMLLRRRKGESRRDIKPDRISGKLNLSSSYFDEQSGEEISYNVKGIVPSLVMMFFAGSMVGMFGVGGGALYVPIMDYVMKVPVKVAAATSTFMIGVTASVGAVMLFFRGEIIPDIAAPVAAGVLVGSFLGSKFMNRVRADTIRYFLAAVLIYSAVNMIIKVIKT